jgi:hypothetical protein
MPEDVKEGLTLRGPRSCAFGTNWTMRNAVAAVRLDLEQGAGRDPITRARETELRAWLDA